MREHILPFIFVRISTGKKGSKGEKGEKGEKDADRLAINIAFSVKILYNPSDSCSELMSSSATKLCPMFSEVSIKCVHMMRI